MFKTDTKRQTKQNTHKKTKKQQVHHMIEQKQNILKMIIKKKFMSIVQLKKIPVILMVG